MNHQDQLVKATINSFMLQCIAGLFLKATKGKGAVPNVDPEDLDYLQQVADGVANQVLFQSKQQKAPIGEEDNEDAGIDMEFECPVFVVQMICTVLRAAADVLSDTPQAAEVRQLATAWVPHSTAALDVILDMDGEREAFNNSWESSDG